MPIYEFVCRKCGRRFECLVPMGKEKDAVCPGCGAGEARKVLSSFGIGGGSRLKTSSSSCGTCSSKSCSTCH
ncbi:MAG TPA: zinc ribbon domain-containing protein [Burkholderiales bacterium]|nr:zinc ribbon domain-containing protein [Burkholderiales bacterium]